MYNSNLRKSVFQKNIARNFTSTKSSGVGDVIPVSIIETKEIIECSTISDSNITLSGSQTINGVLVSDGELILVNGQTTPKENGIYIANLGLWNRISNNLNDISFILIFDGTFAGNVYYLDNKPVTINQDDINYVALRQNNESNVLTAIYEFDETDLIASISTLQTIIPAKSGFEIMPLQTTLIVTINSLVVANPSYLTFTNGSLYTNRIEDTDWTNVAPYRANLLQGIQTAQFEPNYYASGDDWGLYSPSLSYVSGSISGKFLVSYLYIPNS